MFVVRLASVVLVAFAVIVDEVADGTDGRLEVGIAVHLVECR